MEANATYKKEKKEKKAKKKEKKAKKDKKEKKDKKAKKRKREGKAEEEHLSVAEQLECEQFRAAVQGTGNSSRSFAGAGASIGIEGESNETLARKLGLSASLIRSSSDSASSLTSSFGGGDDGDDNPAKRARQKREFVAQRALAIARDELARRAAVAAKTTDDSVPSMLEQMKKRFVSSSS